MTELLLEYLTPKGTNERLRIPIHLLASDPDEVLRRLKAAGVEMRPGCEHLVIEYLISQSAVGNRRRTVAGLRAFPAKLKRTGRIS
jgi:hypothetical protein